MAHVDYVTGDLDPSPIADHRLDITSIPFPDESFDWVLCSHVLEHVPRDDLAFAEIRRVLKPDGLALLQHPIDDRREMTFKTPEPVTDPKVREELFGQSDHVRIYGRDFADRARQAGLAVEEIRYVETLPDDTVARYRLRDPSEMRSQDIYRCTRGAAGWRHPADR